MKKKLTILSVIGLCLCMLFTGAACASSSKLDEYRKQGYKISVTYDANGGSFLNRPGITLIDLFNPDDYAPGSDGKVRISLVEPTDDSRQTSSSDPITLTMTNYFFAGWYRNRDVVTNDAGKPVDEEGKELVLRDDGSYVYADSVNDENAVSVTPAYSYSGYWDFDNDVIEYSEADYEDGICEITLYAGWVKYYEFRYHYKVEGDTEWTTLSETTTFNYKTTNAAGSVTYDKDTVWLPDWSDGAMNHEYLYSNMERYKFPKIDGTTFYKAYNDEACTDEIDGVVEHKGTLDLETATAVNRVHDIYIVVKKGEQYRISTAEQLINNANPAGYYEILNDLDFDGLAWPMAFSAGKFSGKMAATEGESFTLKNITATFSSSSASAGGLFGQIVSGAEISNLTFEKVTFDLSDTGSRKINRQYGLFSGNIETGAKLSNVKVGGLMRIGGNVHLGSGYTIHLLANGSVDGLENTGIALEIYGIELSASGTTNYVYNFDPLSVKVDSDGYVQLDFLTSPDREGNEANTK